VASQQWLEEQAAWNQNCKDWTVRQQAAMAQLAAQQQALETQVSDLISTAAKKKQRKTPTYIQSAAPPPAAAAAPTISSLPGVAPRSPMPAPQTQGGVEQGGPPPPLTRQPGTQQQALETQVSDLISTAAKKKQRKTPTYIQSAASPPAAAAAPTISSLPGVAPRSPMPAPQTQGGAERGGPPPPPTRQLGRASHFPSLPPLPLSSEEYTPPPRSPLP